MKKLEQLIGILQTKKEHSNGKTELFSGKIIGWWNRKNFITRLQKLVERCDYEGEQDNQVRDRAISFTKDRNLKAKLYRDGNSDS